MDEMDLHIPKEIKPDQKDKLMFRWRLRFSAKTAGVRLCIEMLVLTKNMVYASLPEAKRNIMDSPSAITMVLWSQSLPINWDSNGEGYGLTFVPSFGIFNSDVLISDSSVRRIAFDIIANLKAGKKTNSTEEIHKFFVGKSTLPFNEEKLELVLPRPGSISVIRTGLGGENSGKRITLSKGTVIHAKIGSKYHRKIDLSSQNIKCLQSTLPREATMQDAINMHCLMSHSIADTTATKSNSVKRKILSLFPERNVFQYPKPGDDALILTRLAQDPGLKEASALQYMKNYKTLVKLEGATPPAESPHYKQLVRGLRNRGLNPMKHVAVSHRKAFSISSLRIVRHAIASTNWSEFRKQVVFTAMLTAFGGD